MHEKPKNHNEVKRAHEESSHEKKSLDARKYMNNEFPRRTFRAPDEPCDSGDELNGYTKSHNNKSDKV